MATKGIPFQNILRGTPANRFDSAEKVRITKMKLTRRGKELVKAKCSSYTPGSSSSYDTEIEFLASKRVKLSCSCDDFVFRFEYALYSKGGADLRYGNGETPDKTNPAMIPGCCKHVIALRNILIEKQYIEG